MSNDSSIFGNITKLGGAPIVSDSPTPSLANEPAQEPLAVQPASKNTINRESPGQRGCGTQTVGVNYVMSTADFAAQTNPENPTMCEFHPQFPALTGMTRRHLLRASAATPALFALGSGLVGTFAHAAALTQAQRDAMTPDRVIELMKHGNLRFRRGEKQQRDSLAEQRASAKGQYPAAVILSCIDSRAPAERIMDLGIGDVFNARVAGNVANDDILGSLEFACKLSGAKVVVVMGHTACGAIKGAIDNAELGNLTGLLARIKPAVQATVYNGERTAKNYDFVDLVAKKNVELTVADIRQRSPVLAELETNGSIKIVGAMYRLDTGAVDFYR